jgi:hypothetical protein
MSLIAMGRGTNNMSKLATGIFAAIGVSLTVGAAQFASGRDLISGAQNELETPAAAINRAAKTDRATGVAGPAAQTRTISFRLDSLSDTSILVRLPVVKESRMETGSSSSAPSLTRSGERKATVACETVVSVLTEVAKQLEPGRCVT